MGHFRLRVFCSVAHHLSFTKAAQELRITQPAISMHIQELEQEFKTQLFNRLNGRIELTAAGELFLLHARRIMAHYDKLYFDMNMLSHNLSGGLRVGASDTIAQYIIPSHLASFTTLFKDITLSLIQGNNREIEAAVEEQRIDVGMVEGYNRNPHLRYTPFMHDEVVLVTSTAQEWAYLDTVSLQEFAQLPLVLPEHGKGITEVVEQALELHDITLSQLNVKMQLSSSESLKNFILHAPFVALISLQAVKQEIERGILKVVNVEGLKLEREMAFVRRIGETPEIVKDFISYMHEGLRYGVL